MAPPLMAAPAAKRARKPGKARSPRSSQKSPRVLRAAASVDSSPRSLEEEAMQRSRWDFPSKQLLEIQSRVHDLEQLVSDYEALQSEVEALPANTEWTRSQVRAVVGATPTSSRPPAPRSPGVPAFVRPSPAAARSPRSPRAARGAESRAVVVAAPPAARPGERERYVARAKNPKRRYTAARYDARPAGPASGAGDGAADGLPHDESLLRVCQKLDAGLMAYMTRSGVHFVVGSSWSKFFELMDADKSGRVTFDELRGTLESKLRIKGLSRYELRVFWARVDVDDSGEATYDEFMSLMYRVRLGTWPDLDDAGCERIIGVLDKAAEKWHRASGNWYKIFRQFDQDASGEMSFEEFCAVVRNRFPGIAVEPRALPDEEIQGLWKRLDADRSSRVSVQEFMIFMRRHGAALSMHRLTDYARAKRGLVAAVDAPPAVALEPGDVLRVFQVLNRALIALFRRRGVHSSIRGNWTRIFKEMDADGSGRLRYDEFAAAARAIGVSDKACSDRDLGGIWTHVDGDGSGEVSIDEFNQATYCLQVAPWPDLLVDDEAERLARVIATMNAAADKWHRAAGNWYKIFRMFDSDDSGKMGYEELEHVLRAGFPGLHVPAEDLKDDDIKGLWKALDADRSREVCVQEFMVFMRRHGAAHSMHRLTEYARNKRGLIVAAEAFEPVELPVERLRFVTQRLHRALGAYLRRHGVRLSIAEMWKRLFEIMDEDGSGRVHFEELRDAVRKLGVAETSLSLADIAGLWTYADGDGSGELSSDEFQDCVYRLEVEAWQDFDTVEGGARLRGLVTVMNTAAEKWHRASGNWYKIFRMFDADDSGLMCYEELETVLRTGYPGLGLSEKQVSDAHMKGLWRSLDADRSGSVSVQEFMVFMRRHGDAHAMHRLTNYSMEKRGLTPTATTRPKHVELPVDQLHAVTKRIDRALTLEFRRRGVHTSIAGNVKRLFSELDQDGSDRICFSELEEAVRQRLNLREDALSHSELLGLWTYVDKDKSGALTAAEFQGALYDFEIESWPDYLAPESTAELRRVLGVMNAAAEKWHQAGGNWFKIFKRLDTDDSGQMGFEELEHIIRAIFPGLHVDRKDVSDENLRGLWKALDVDRSGLVSIQEFMIFMRRHAALHETIPYIRSTKRDELRRVDGSLDRLDIKFGFRLDKLRVLAEACKRLPPEGTPITEWGFCGLVRDDLAIDEAALTDDDVHVVWRAIDATGAGAVSRAAFLDWALDPPPLRIAELENITQSEHAASRPRT